MFGKNLPGTQVGDTESSPFVQVIVDDPEITKPLSHDTLNVAPEWITESGVTVPFSIMGVLQSADKDMSTVKLWLEF